MAITYVPHVGPIVTPAEAKQRGLKRYFTGKACIAGHVSERILSDKTCQQCKREARASNREASNALERAARIRDPDAAKARTARYLASDKAKAARRAYYEANVETIKRRAAKHKQDNPERALANRQAWYLANVEAVKERVREWNAANPEAVRVRGRNYRARSRQAEGTHTAADVLRIGEAQKWRCHWCSKPVPTGYHVDHIQPLAKGGSNWPSNLCISCGPCNVSKRATDPIVFAQRSGRLL